MFKSAGRIVSGIFTSICFTAFTVLPPANGEETATSPNSADKPESRTFELRYGATIVGVPAGSKARVWLPVPTSNKHQTVKHLDKVLPFEASVAREKKFGNEMLYFETNVNKTGSFAFTTSYQIKRDEIVRQADGNTKIPNLTNEQKSLFLSASTKVPIAGKPTELIANLKLPNEPVEIGRSLYLRVDELMTYDKSKPGYGNGDVLWACDSRTGNCTDFHSMFISLARNKNIPARFEIGFPLPPKRGRGTIAGYHCWAMFFAVDRGWIPVDISEADKNPKMKEYYFGNLTENRVMFTTGRDINLVPKQDGPPLNYFVYPYIEVDKKPLPRDNIKLSLEYSDVISLQK